MSICRALLRNTFKALMRQMSGEQIGLRLQFPPKLFSQQLNRADDQALSFRLL